MRDIAERVGVSLMTVSAALGGSYRNINVSTQTRERIVEVAREIGYRPNRIARALATGRTHVIGFWADSLREFYFARAVDDAQTQVRASGYEIIISNMPQVTDWDSQGSLVAQWPVDGIIAFERPRQVEAYLDANPEFAVPIVSVGAYYTSCTDYVGIDYRNGAQEATLHLLETGCRRVLYMLTPFGNNEGDARFRGYTETMLEAGRRPEYLIVEQAKRHLSRQVLTDYLRSNSWPDGIFFFSDEMAIGGYRALCDLGARIPDDIAIIGCDGIDDTEYLEPPLSTIVPPVSEMCAKAWTFLHGRISDPALPLRQETLPSHLVIRASSRRA
jgi:LacI family transcriptional regulator